MHPDNAFYGHKRVLAEYAGLGSRPPAIRGHVQHGWTPSTGLSQPARLVSWLPKFVWSASNRKAAEERGIRTVEAIGAPFCYLDAMAPTEVSAPTAPRSTIYYPHHGWEWDELLGSHRDVIAAIRDREEGPVTVCLYWNEFDQPTVRRLYEDAGFRVICHGYRHEALFLIRQRDELLRHDRVASNRLGTALWYGGYLGRAVKLYGPTMSAENEAEGRAFDQYSRARWPELFDGGADGLTARDMAADELGAAFVLPPDELREILGWTPRKLGYARPAQAAARAEHHVRRMAYNVRARLPRTTPLPRF
ncbi:MAG: hypothetical protein ACRD2W_24055 [Acidimicrobiales bacterium]